MNQTIDKPEVRNLVRTRIPTEQGEFTLYYYHNNIDNKEHIALVRGNVEHVSGIPVRVHSECFTGDVIGSRRCDCREQFQLAMEFIGSADCGVLIYLRQEGRGIGLLEKLKAYNLQDQGLDTVDANIQLGHLPDERDYQVAALILKDLKIGSVRLLTNNPNKMTELDRLGIKVDGRVPIEVNQHGDNEDYLKTKAERMSHWLSLGQETSRLENMTFLRPLIDELSNVKLSDAEKPFVTVSYAQSIDGSIAVNRSESISLSCAESLKMTHLVRSRHDALLVGINTIMVDDPALTVRYSEGSDPQPVILDSQLRFPVDAQLLESRTQPPIILTTEQAGKEKKRILTDKGARVFEVPCNSNNQVDLDSALEVLSGLGFKTLMVEGGGSVINRFLAEQLVDYCIVTIAPKLIGGLKAVESLCLTEKAPPIAISDCRYQQIGSDVIAYGHLVTA